MCGAGEHDWRVPEHSREQAHSEQRLAGRLFGPGSEIVRDDTDIATNRARQIGRAFEVSMAPRDCAGLLNVECLARGGARGSVNDRQTTHVSARGERRRDRAADVTGSDDRDRAQCPCIV